MTVEKPFKTAQEAHETYQALVGDMMFLNNIPGVLDRDRRDFDILDDGSLQNAEIQEGQICVHAERYSTLVLPSCAVLQAASADRLVDFVRSGGRLIVVGGLPRLLVGAGDYALEDLLSLFQSRRAMQIEKPEDLPLALGEVLRRVEAPVPVLHRRIEGLDVLFVPAAYPHATDTTGLPNESWLRPSYRFDPDRYQRSMALQLRGFSGSPELWNVLTGERQPLSARSVGDFLEVVVPFDDSPVALLVWTGSGQKEPQVQPGEGQTLMDLAEGWSCLLEPTLDNRYGDFSKPDHPGAPAVQTWRFAHRIQGSNEDGLREGWFREGSAFPGTNQVHATYGQYGWFTGPLPPDELPGPLESPIGTGGIAPEGWQPVVYSLQRGIYKDPLHMRNLGPKAHVPEEFLRFGPAQAGQAVQFRTAFWLDAPRRMHLALGAPAEKQIWLNGQALETASEAGYLCLKPVEVRSGMNILEFRLLADKEGDLRAYWALIQSREAFVRPERMTSPDQPKKDSQLQFMLDFDLPFIPSEFTIQVSANAPTRLLVNGSEMGRQGGFDPYYSLARVQPYWVGNAVKGANTIVIELQDTGLSRSKEPAAVLVDGLARDSAGQAFSLISGEHWRVSRDGSPAVPVNLYRPQLLDPAWSHLRRRPHPLPGAAWLEGEQPGEVVLPIVPDAGFGQVRIEWFRWQLPPGANTIHLPVMGQARLWVDGTELDASSPMVVVPPSEQPQRWAVMRLATGPGQTAGGAFAGPVTYTVAPGRIAIGEWSAQGLEAYSGGVRYQNSFELASLPEGRLWLDLGRVRGTAEVWINGQPAGVRVWSPYQFDLSAGLQAGRNEVEILVLNTLAPYLEAVSPTHYIHPGQAVSGLLGPVRLRLEA
jgi:hypothetical protein